MTTSERYITRRPLGIFERILTQHFSNPNTRSHTLSLNKMKFFATALVAVLAFAMLVAADVAKVKSDVQNIDKQATALEQSLEKEDGSVSTMRSG